MDQTFKRGEKLKGEKLIERLFREGKSVAAYPLRMVYVPASFEGPEKIKVGVSVSKRNFKKAVHRNRLKRLMREAYRLNKEGKFDHLPQSYAFMVLYQGKTMENYEVISKKMKTLIHLFTTKVCPPNIQS